MNDIGPLWLDIAGCELDSADKEILAHPMVGGVILFARNYHDNKQLLELNKQIRIAAKKNILIGVDQEGGRVQRFREGFSLIPPASSYAQLGIDEVQSIGVEAAQYAGWLMAAELIAHDIDLSFAPVLDQGFQCKAIGNRAFGEDAQTILTYSSAFIRGMKQAGMATTGKHFPGHGGVLVDSHEETPFDLRQTIFEDDMAIFKSQINAGLLDAMMPAHVVYSYYDNQPASGSSYWLKQVLRQQLGFKGIIFSDDLNMEGASIMGGAADRARIAMESGCDMVLMCNNRQGAIEILDHLPQSYSNAKVPQANMLMKKQSLSLSELQSNPKWKKARDILAPLLP